MTTADLTADVVLFAPDERGEQNVLLIRRSWDSDAYPGYFALPGGYLDDGETFHEAAERELAEETGILMPPVTFNVGCFDTPDRDPRGRVISCAFRTHMPEMPEVRPADDAVDFTWAPAFAIGVGRRMELAFDHNAVIARAYGHYLDDLPQAHRR